MQKQNRTLRRSVERKVPGYVRVIVALLYAATLLFTILGAMFGILFMPLALGSLFGGWYLMGEARVIYEYRLDGRTLTVMRTSGMRSRQKEIEFFTLQLDDLIAVAAEGTQPMRDAEALTLRGEAQARLLRRIRTGSRSGVRVPLRKGERRGQRALRSGVLSAVSGFCGRDTGALPRKGDDDGWRNMKTRRRA